MYINVLLGTNHIKANKNKKSNEFVCYYQSSAPSTNTTITIRVQSVQPRLPTKTNTVRKPEAISLPLSNNEFRNLLSVIKCDTTRLDRNVGSVLQKSEALNKALKIF